jgi:RNA polymerase sigma factor (sigma-70 family)
MARNNDAFTTRRSLLLRIKNPDDRESWQDFFQTYSGLIHAVAIRAGLTESEAQEVVQETMIAVSKKIAEFDYDPSKGKFKGWLLKLTGWRIDDQFRKRRAQAQRHGESSGDTSRTSTAARIPDPRGSDLEAIWDQEWRENLFQLAVEKVKRLIDPKQYLIFDLYVIKQWPPEKVARVMNITKNKVFLAKHRILQLVKKEVTRCERQLL